MAELEIFMVSGKKYYFKISVSALDCVETLISETHKGNRFVLFADMYLNMNNVETIRILNREE